MNTHSQLITHLAFISEVIWKPITKEHVKLALNEIDKHDIGNYIIEK